MRFRLCPTSYRVGVGMLITLCQFLSGTISALAQLFSRDTEPLCDRAEHIRQMARHSRRQPSRLADLPTIHGMFIVL